MPKVHNRIKEIREAAGLKQVDLSTKTALSSAAISQFESGERNPSLTTLKMIAKALNVTINDLLGEKQNNEELDPAAQILFRDYVQLNTKDKEAIADIIRSLKKKT